MVQPLQHVQCIAARMMLVHGGGAFVGSEPTSTGIDFYVDIGIEPVTHSWLDLFQGTKIAQIAG